MRIFIKYHKTTELGLIFAGFGAYVLFYLLNMVSWYTLDPATSPLNPTWLHRQCMISSLIWAITTIVLGRWLLLEKRPPIHVFWPYYLTTLVWFLHLFIQIVHFSNLFSYTIRDFFTPYGPKLIYVYNGISAFSLILFIISFLWYRNFPKPDKYIPSKNKRDQSKNKGNKRSKKLKAFFHRFLIIDIIKGLCLTGKNIFKEKKTIQFPDEKMPTSPRFRGILALRRYPNGEERCIACKLCEAVCPALAITIESEPRKDGSRRTKRFDVDMFKCINCGFCEEACPVDSIVVTSEHHYVVRNRGENILTKQKLLAIGDRCEQQLALDRAKDEPYR